MNAITGDLIGIDDPRWAGVLSSVRHDVYHTVEYVELEATRLGGEPKAFVVDDDDRIFFVPLVVRRVDACTEIYDALSPYGYPGALLNDEAKKNGFLDQCLDAMRVCLRERKICSAFLRMHPIIDDDLADHMTDEALTPNGMTVSIDLDQPAEAIWSAMRKGHTNAVNKARRFGYEVTVGPALESFDEFHAVYSESLVRLQAESRYHFDESYLRTIASFPCSYVVLARLGDEVAGAYLLFDHQGIVQMHLGGPAQAFMKPSASNLMIYEVARWGQERGSELVHLGGGLGGAADDSLFLFKSGFSPLRHRYDTLRVVADRDVYDGLVLARARELGVSPAELADSSFFPAYRAS